MIRTSRPTPGLLDFSPGSDEELEELRERFQRGHHVVLPGLLDPELFDEISQQLDRADFYARDHPGIKVEDNMKANGHLMLLFLVANDPRLFRVVQAITGCGSIGCFAGRVYRMDPASAHHDSWHDDLGDDRLVAMSLNLTREPYSGGVLQLRDTGSEEILLEAHNVGAGDALLFRLDERLSHRVTPVEGRVPKVAFAGWFKSRPSFASLFKGAVKGA